MGELIGRQVAQAGGSSDLVMTVLMVASMFAVIYFLMIRPQRKQQEQQQQLLSALKKGDEVLLTSGIYGKIYSLSEKTAVVEIADKTRVKLLKSSIHGRVSAPPADAEPVPEDLAKEEKAEKKKKSA